MTASMGDNRPGSGVADAAIAAGTGVGVDVAEQLTLLPTPWLGGAALLTTSLCQCWSR